MNEAELVQKISSFLRENLTAPVVVIKHHDRVTAGVPDMSVSYRGRTTWLEVKWWPQSSLSLPSTRRKIDSRQLASLHRLALTGVTVRYIIGFTENKKTRLAIMSPLRMVLFLKTGSYKVDLNQTGQSLNDDLAWLVHSLIIPVE